MRVDEALVYDGSVLCVCRRSSSSSFSLFPVTLDSSSSSYLSIAAADAGVVLGGGVPFTITGWMRRAATNRNAYFFGAGKTDGTSQDNTSQDKSHTHTSKQSRAEQVQIRATFLLTICLTLVCVHVSSYLHCGVRLQNSNHRPSIDFM